ncbi:MAG TPA: type II toxin-antitoxin system RelE/ParE family toxin [Methylocystis sp.]|nr:type II toxin-antitoxin system RelE/ParE family toxin [Methylocystis sp.]
MTRYRLSPEAEKDLKSIRLYLTRNGGVRVARYVLREIRRSMRLLAESPGLGHRRSDLAEAQVKFWSVFSYLIVYDSASAPMSVIRILHGRRDVEKALQEVRPANSRP